MIALLRRNPSDPTFPNDIPKEEPGPVTSGFFGYHVAPRRHHTLQQTFFVRHPSQAVPTSSVRCRTASGDYQAVRRRA